MPATERARRFVAPGRVNLIGEHTDYNFGFVLPAAIDRYTCCEITPTRGNVLRVYSAAIDDTVEIALREPFARTGTWRDYAAGVVAAVNDVAPLPRGAEVRVESDLPIGGGLASSAAFELALAQALFSLTEVAPEPLRLAELCMRAEREFVGIRSGAMDQLTSALGVAEHALLLDCKTLGTTPVALQDELRIAVLDSQTKHGLVHSEYNARRAQCEEAVAVLQRAGWEVESLRDLEVGRLDEARGLLTPTLARRVQHVVTENARVQELVAGLVTGDVAAIGEAMRASHASLRDDYEVTTPELDALAEAAREVPGIVGARMTGGGFGGCVVALIEEAAFEELRTRVRDTYYAPRGLTATVFLTHAVNGAHEIER
jgi:galactokinase